MMALIAAAAAKRFILSPAPPFEGQLNVRISENLKPNDRFGERTARMCQSLIQKGIALKQIVPIVQGVFWHSLNFDIATEINIKLVSSTVKILGLGITTLDSDELIKTMQRAPLLTIAEDEFMRNGNQKYPHLRVILGHQTIRPLVWYVSRGEHSG